jgi:hypothetical protein
LQFGTNTELLFPDQEINLGKHTHGSSLAIPKFSTFTLLWGAATLNWKLKKHGFKQLLSLKKL